MQKKSKTSSAEHDRSGDTGSERAIVLNLNFFELGILSGCLETARQPFLRKQQLSRSLEQAERVHLNAINALYDLILMQARLSTAKLGAERVNEELKLVVQINQTFAATYASTLKEILRS